MPGPVASRFGDGRLHLQHGPIDLVIIADGDTAEAARAEAAMTARFATILDELVAELDRLRADVESEPHIVGETASRMLAATRELRSGEFATAMVAVAGSVADTIADVGWAAARLRRLVVNNGGDIALRQVPDSVVTIGVVDDVTTGDVVGRLHVDGRSGIGGVATSGWGGRSFSFGIADAVTVLARTAAHADVAASLVANAVDLPGHPSVIRRRACDIKHDSDLGERLVTCGLGDLTPQEVETALDSGTERAEVALAHSAILGVVLCLRGHRRMLLPPTVPTVPIVPTDAPSGDLVRIFHPQGEKSSPEYQHNDTSSPL